MLGTGFEPVSVWNINFPELLAILYTLEIIQARKTLT